MTLIFYLKKKLQKIFLLQIVACMKQINIYLPIFFLNCRKRSKNRADRYVKHCNKTMHIIFT